MQRMQNISLNRISSGKERQNRMRLRTSNYLQSQFCPRKTQWSRTMQGQTLLNHATGLQETFVFENNVKTTQPFKYNDE